MKAHENFADPEWDGEPVAPDPPGPGPKPGGGDGGEGDGGDDGGGEGPEPPAEKVKIKLADGKERNIAYAGATTYWSADGKPITVKEFLDRLVGDMGGLIANADELRKVWSNPERRERLIGQLADRGYDADRLQDIRRLVDAPHNDLFDVLSYILYVRPAKTRQDRAEGARSADASADGEEMKALLIAILSAYEENGEQELATSKLGEFLKARYGSVGEGKQRLGELPVIKAAFLRLQETLDRG